MHFGPVLVPTSKFSPPTPRPGDVRRTRLLARMCAAHAPVLALLAPAGSGKTTVAGQWAAECDRAIVWLSLDDTDNDPVVLISTLVAAISKANGGDPTWRGQVTGDDPEFARVVRPRLRTYIEALPAPTTIVIDDVHEIHDARSRVVLEILCEAVPAGSQVALVGRSMAGLRAELWHGRGRLEQIAPTEFAFDQQEARAVLAALDVQHGQKQDWQRIFAATEGWPVAVYLSAKSMPTTPMVIGASWPPHDLTAYLDQEVLAATNSEVRHLLRRTAILDTLCGSLCDAVAVTTNSYLLLRQAHMESSLILRLDGPGDWYRLHSLLRQRLLEEYSQAGGDLRLGHRRASEWFRDRGFTDNAISHAIHSGDIALMGAEIWDEAIRTILFGRVARLMQWLDRIPVEQVRMSAALSMSTAWAGINTGDSALARHWLAHASHLLSTETDIGDTPATLRPMISLMQAVSSHAGFAVSAELAHEAYQLLPVAHPVRPLALLQVGLARTLSGDVARGRDAMASARALATAAEIGNTWAQAAALEAAFAYFEDDVDAGEALIAEACVVWETQQLSGSAATELFISAVKALQAARAGARDEVRMMLTRTAELTPLLAPILVWLQVVVHVLAARTQLALGDVARAGEALARCREALRSTPASPYLTTVITRLEADFRAAANLDELSPAERRVWELLRRRLTLQEIADSLYVSRETVKTQTASIYRKLGVRNRREAQEFADAAGSAMQWDS